ncbi:putative Cytochrome oxidase c assembly-containing protein [Homarus americanus]|uniref:Putative Cytochrome oxidase c assembly-containing protein n=1 Tax=Homarus americanus TaxID=6706 RepID=A0A8J5TJ21_HOMAM|nr:putative Cytochrome oxidase c assembly-containing protein [Homarus americanus]
MDMEIQLDVVMRKLPRASRVADFLHKSFVVTCVGMTLFSMFIIGERTYSYFYVIKPRRLEEERRKLAEEESKSFETEIPDIAETLKA